MTENQILGVPTCQKEMLYSVSLSGITKLKEGRYKQRHNLSRELVQCPDLGIMTIVQYKKLGREYIKPVHKKKKEETKLLVNKSDEKKVRLYAIDKTTVKHKIKQYILQMRGEKLLYFWTITFPLGTNDNTVFILWNKWLTRLRQEKLLHDYIWVTERQKNNTVHFHMVINNRMDVKKANKYMRASIMHSINSNEINYSREKAKNYNGVDLAKDRSTKRVINFAKKNKTKALTVYLTKYITKNDTKFTHLAWHSSRGYSNLITQIRITVSEYNQGDFHKQLKKSRTIETEYYTFTAWDGSPPHKVTEYFKFVNSYILSILN